MIDILAEIDAIHRQVSRTGETVVVVIRRTYEADVDEVWNAITDPERIRRWFVPVAGELAPGGTFELEGHAGGDVLECEQPNRFKITLGGADSVVEVKLTQATSSRTELEATHTVDSEVVGGIAGSLYLGPGWDEGMFGLARYLRQEISDGQDPRERANSPETKSFAERSTHAWIAVLRATGLATEDEIRPAAEASLAHFAPGATVS